MLHYTPQHISSNTLLIIRRTNFITTASGIVTLCKQPYSMQVESGLQSPLHPHTVRLFVKVTIPEAVVIQLILLMMSSVLNCVTTASGIVTLCKQPYSMQVESRLQSALHPHTVRLFVRVMIPEAVVIQLILLMMSSVLLETC